MPFVRLKIDWNFSTSIYNVIRLFWPNFAFSRPNKRERHENTFFRSSLAGNSVMLILNCLNIRLPIILIRSLLISLKHEVFLWRGVGLNRKPPCRSENESFFLSRIYTKKFSVVFGHYTTNAGNLEYIL